MKEFELVIPALLYDSITVIAISITVIAVSTVVQAVCQCYTIFKLIMGP